MRGILAVCVLLFYASSFMGVHSAGVTCDSVPISLANITSCIDNQCTTSTTIGVSLPNFPGSSLCVEFLSPNTESDTYALNVTIVESSMAFEFDYCYLTDDPYRESKGLCGCPGGTNAVCPCSAVSVSSDFPSVCSAGIHDDSYCILNHIGRTGTWCGKTTLYIHPRYMVCHTTGAYTKMMNFSVTDGDGTWLLSYDGTSNYVALNDTVARVRVLSDTVDSSFQPSFVVWDTWKPETAFYMSSGEVNSLIEFDPTKIGWIKGANNPKDSKVSPTLGQLIQYKILDCEDNKFQVHYPFVNIQGLFNGSRADEIMHVTPGAYVIDVKGNRITGIQLSNTPSRPVWEHLDGLSVASSPFGGQNFINPATSQNLPFTYSNSSAYTLNCLNTPLKAYSINTACSNVLLYDEEYNKAVCRGHVNGSFVYFIAEIVSCDPALPLQTPDNCLQSNATAWRWADSVNTFSTTDQQWIQLTVYPSFRQDPLLITQIDYNRMRYYPRNPFSPLAGFQTSTTAINIQPARLIIPVHRGSFQIAIEYHGASVTFQQTNVKPMIKSLGVDSEKEHIILQAATITSPGTCYVYSYPPGLILTTPVELISTVQEFKIPTYAVYADGKYTVGVRCYQYSATSSLFVKYNRTNTAPADSPDGFTPGWENSFDPRNIGDVLSSIFDGDFDIPNILSSILYLGLAIVVVVVGIVVLYKVGLLMLKRVSRNRSTSQQVPPHILSLIRGSQPKKYRTD